MPAPKPSDVAAFHAAFDAHPDDRVHLFHAIAGHLPSARRVLYAGSYVDVAPSVWFPDVHYLDMDKRAAKFFQEEDKVLALVEAKREAFNPEAESSPTITFHHQDYTRPIPLEEGSVDLLVSLYAGFISEHCTAQLRVGGSLLVNPSHGDAALASIDPRYKLAGVVTAKAGRYTVSTRALEEHLIPKKAQTITKESLHASGKGVAYTKPAFAYLFTRVA